MCMYDVSMGSSLTDEATDRPTATTSDDDERAREDRESERDDLFQFYYTPFLLTLRVHKVLLFIHKYAYTYIGREVKVSFFEVKVCI
jgi:hypothetical protein